MNRAETGQNGTENHASWWNDKRTEAARLVAEGQLTEQEIRDLLKIGRTTLTRWKITPQFRQRVAEIVEKHAAHAQAEGIRLRVNRLRNLQDRIDRMTRLIDARAQEFAATSETAGGDTGLLARDYKGKNADRAVYRFDAALVRELREHERQAAQELGQWAEKHEIGGPGGGPVRIIVEYESSDDDQD